MNEDVYLKIYLPICWIKRAASFELASRVLIGADYKTAFPNISRSRIKKENGRGRRDRVGTQRGLGRVDSRVPRQRPLSTHLGAEMDGGHASLQIVAASLQRSFPPLDPRSRDTLRLVR